MNKTRHEILMDSMERVGKLLALYCEIAESAARVNVQFKVGPNAELVETTGADHAKSSLCAVERLSIAMERLAGVDRKENTPAGDVTANQGMENDMEQGNCIVTPETELSGRKTEKMLDGSICVCVDSESGNIFVYWHGKDGALELTRKEAMWLGQILTRGQGR